MEAFLETVLPKLLRGNVTFQIYPSRCKKELLKNLPNRLKGYSRWLPATWRIIVVLDRDNDNCRRLKQRLEDMAGQANLRTLTSGANNWRVANRIVVEELEAWFFGDMDAVRTVYPRVAKTIECKASYQNPDAIRGGTWEAFERILQHAGYFRSGLRKIEAARQIGPHIEPDRNRSRSFKVFCQAIDKAIEN